MSRHVAVVGAGAWGTALAHVLGVAGNPVRLWAYEPEVAEAETPGPRVVFMGAPAFAVPRSRTTENWWA